MLKVFEPGFSIRMNTCVGMSLANTPLNAGLGVRESGLWIIL